MPEVRNLQSSLKPIYEYVHWCNTPGGSLSILVCSRLRTIRSNSSREALALLLLSPLVVQMTETLTRRMTPNS